MIFMIIPIFILMPFAVLYEKIDKAFDRYYWWVNDDK